MFLRHFDVSGVIMTGAPATIGIGINAADPMEPMFTNSFCPLMVSSKPRHHTDLFQTPFPSRIGLGQISGAQHCNALWAP